MQSSSEFNLQETVLLASETRVVALAAILRPLLAAGDTVLLSGPIGAGKSHFARALIHGYLQEIDAVEDIPSPTFTLVQTYHTPNFEIWHSDLYRLTHVDEVVELGLFDAFETALCLVEWPDRLGAETPQNALSLEFGLPDNPDQRTLNFTASHQRWHWITEALRRFENAAEHVDD